MNEPVYSFSKDEPFRFDGMSEFEAQAIFGEMDDVQLLTLLGGYLFAATKPDGKFTEKQLNNELDGITTHQLAVKCFAWVDQIVGKKRINTRSN